MSHANPQPAKNKGCLYRILKWILIALLAFVLFMVVVVSCSDTEDSGQNGAASGTTTSEATPEAEPEAPLTDGEKQEALTSAISEELGEDTIVEVEGEGSMTVTYPVGTGWSEESMAKATQQKTIDVIKLVKESGWRDGEVYLKFHATADMVDEAGNSSNDRIIYALYFPEDIERINPDGIQRENIWEVATEKFVHPVFRY